MYAGQIPFSTRFAQRWLTPANSPVKLLGRYHQWILYSGATMFTILALCAAVIGVAMYAENFIHTQRLLFDSEKRQVAIKVIAADAKMRQIIIRQEFLDQQRNTALTPASTPHYAALPQPTATQNDILFSRLRDTANPLDHPSSNNLDVLVTAPAEISITTTLTPTEQPEMLASLLHQFYDVVPGVRNIAQAGKSTYIMLYDKNKTFLGVHMPQNVRPAIRQQPTPSAAHTFIDDAVAPIEAAIEKIPPAQLRAGKTVWVTPYTDKLTGQQIISRAAVIFHGDKAFSVLVISFPVEEFARHFLIQPMTSGFAVIAANGVALSGEVTEEVARQTLAREKKRPVTLEKYTTSYTNSLNTLLAGDTTLVALSHPIGNTGWIMLYTFDWTMLWSTLNAKILFTMGLALLLSLMLWTLVILFNRLIFVPVFSEALRVHDSEAFNRAMMTVAPLGFFVLNYRTGELLLDNMQACAIASRNCPSNDMRPFHQRLMVCYKNLEEAERAGNDGSQMLTHAVLELPAAAANTDPDYALAMFTRTRYLCNDVLLCCLSDITSQKHAERVLHSAKIEADEANKAKSTFLALISHEIRTPLHGAAGHLELLEMASLAPAERELVHTIRGSFQSLLRIINDILDISRIEAGQLSLENAPFNLRQTVAHCAHLWTPALERKSVAFQCRISPTIPNVFIGDAGRLTQILNNLLSNAAKFTSEGQVLLDITGQAQDTGYVLQMAVRDSGVGITTHDQKYLFRPFSQANAGIAHEFGGTGLGLSLCKQLVDAMGGKITIQSVYGTGTTVLVKLMLSSPAAIALVASPEKTQASSGMLNVMHSQPHAIAINAPLALRILAVEDDPVCRKLLEKQLFTLGYVNVDFVDNGLAALERASSVLAGAPYELILTDMRLPLMSGHELIPSLRRNGLSTPIIVMTASVVNDHIALILPEIDTLLTKPISLSKLKAALARYTGIGEPEAVPETAPLIPPVAPLSQRYPSAEGFDVDIAMIFLDTYRDDLWAILHAFNDGDRATLDGRLHRIKGALLIVQEDNLAQLCEEMCHGIQAKEKLPAPQQLRHFIKGLLRVVRALRVIYPALRANRINQSKHHSLIAHE
ncbi:hybrid sensor histidine kinase/response regulator [Glaciimonas sp. PCH181]|uniref:hybrid sensor histidine kinase/response regulator n=1 Tax=Glaciimonas sp. PCH181 TaxID=2133943 RepID=UPI001374A4F5|nr:hybrid sensor histidine kinase/response regulator [Glaciimonas sp. PCH181]